MRSYMMAMALLGLLSMQVMAEEAASTKDTVLGFYEEVFNKHNVSAIDTFVTPDFVDHNPDPGQAPGVEGVKAAFQALFNAFPDIKVTPGQILVDGNFVTVRSIVTGTQDGEFMGMPASHQAIKVTLIDILELKDGKAAQRWGLIDVGTMLAQLAPKAAEETK